MDDHTERRIERDDGSTVTPNGTWSDPLDAEAQTRPVCGWKPTNLPTSPELPPNADMAMSLLDYRMRQLLAEVLEEARGG